MKDKQLTLTPLEFNAVEKLTTAINSITSTNPQLKYNSFDVENISLCLTCNDTKTLSKFDLSKLPPTLTVEFTSMGNEGTLIKLSSSDIAIDRTSYLAIGELSYLINNWFGVLFNGDKLDNVEHIGLVGQTDRLLGLHSDTYVKWLVSKYVLG